MEYLFMRGVVVSLGIVCLILASGCISPEGTGPADPGTVPGTMNETPPRTMVGVTHPGLAGKTYAFSIRLDKNVINPGDAVAVNITVENHVTRPLTIRPFPPGIKVRDSCGFIVRNIPFGQGDRVIPPLETFVYSLGLEMKDDREVPLPPGRYNVELFWEEELPLFNYTSGPPPPVPTRTGDIIISGWGSSPLIIRYPEGAREEGIEADLTVTVSGLPVTLERLEFTEENVIVTFLYPIPSGTLPPGISSAAISPPPPDTGPGLFSIDGGGACPFPTLPVEPIEGLWRVIGYLPPVSRDSRNLKLVIPELAGQKGPWVFEVPLR